MARRRDDRPRVYLVEHAGPTRETRRHFIDHGTPAKEKWVRYHRKVVPRALRPLATNLPHIKQGRLDG